MTNLRELAALAWMVEQYLPAGEYGFDHQFMNAGERALEVLYAHGLVTSKDVGARWTAKGEKFLKEN
jgi:hypothetical protein